MKQKINFPLAMSLIVTLGTLIALVVLRYGFIPEINILLFNPLEKESEESLEGMIEDENHNGNLYIVKRIGYDGYQDEDWVDELWKYNKQEEGLKIFSGKGFGFSVSPNENYIAIDFNYFNPNEIIILNQNGDVVKRFNSDQFNKNYTLTLYYSPVWSKNSNELWCVLNFTYTIDYLIEINVTTWNTIVYDISKLDFDKESSLNIEKKKLLYSDFPGPVYFSEYSYEEFKESGKEVKLYIYDLITKENKLIDISIADPFNPVWVNNDIFEYDDPEGVGRVSFNLDE